MKNKQTGAASKAGIYSYTIRQRFDDLRTSQGQQLATTMKSLTDHFGAENITAHMQIMMDANIRPKIITMVLISDWINKQVELVSPKGELPAVLDKNYIAFSNALRRVLQALCDMAKESGMNAKPPKLEDLID